MRGRRVPPHYPSEWKRKNKKWMNLAKKNPSLTLQFEKYLELNHTLHMLYAMSFSADNFPQIFDLSERDLGEFFRTGLI